ncbi:MAG TPA: lysoplasmalogenase [Candidatus Hydrogenedentes bacterium]|nr:lysoplasmalogenase [Candidatus Hydrogenedentota bacterium]
MAKWFIGTCVFAILLVTGTYLDWGIFPGIFKQLASTCFIMAVWSAGARENRYGRLILAGLCFSWCGDAFLIKGGDTFFLLGLGSFLFAHVLYCSAFILHGVSWKWSITSLLVIIPTVIAIMSDVFSHVSDDMKIPVGIYTIVITAMVMLAVGTQGVRSNRFIVVGAVMFYFSDVSVARSQFLDTGFPYYVWGLPLYYMGQLLLALSVWRNNEPD